MTIDEAVKGFDLVINGKLTFAGVLKKGMKSGNIGRRWKSPNTIRNNLRNYKQRILPKFAGYSLDAFNLEDCERFVDELSMEYEGNEYATSTKKDYLRLIRVVYEEGARMGVCQDPFWGSKSTQRNTYSLDERVAKVAKKLIKFFSVEQERKIWNLLFNNPHQDACSMGLLLMFITGARNLEAAAICYEDIVMKGGKPCIGIYNSIDGLSAKAKAGTKTKNGYRYYPISMLVYDFLMERKAWIQAKVDRGEIEFLPGCEFQCVDNLPIACDGRNWFQYCTPNDLTDAGRELFKRIGITADQWQIICDNMKEDEKNPLFGNFKDPTSYSFRRSAASHLYDTNCTMVQCRYLFGHSFNYESVERYHLVNDDQINKMRKKLENRPLVNEINYAGTFARFDYNDDELYLKNVNSATLSINTKGHSGQTLIVRVLPREPHEVTMATLSLVDPIDKTGVRASYRNCRHIEKEQPSDVVVPREIHSLYDYWKPYVEAFKADCITIKEMFTSCNDKRLLTCVADIEEISYDDAVAHYLPVLKGLTDIVPTEKTERYVLAMVNTSGTSVMCFNVADARTFLAENSRMDRMTEETLAQSASIFDLECNSRILQRNSIRGYTREDVLSMRIPEDIISKIGAERIAAQILSQMTATSADADITKCEDAAVTTSEEKLEQNREQVLFIRRVYHLLKEHSYLWCV